MKTIWMTFMVASALFVGAMDCSAQPSTSTQQVEKTLQLRGSGKKDRKEDKKSTSNHHTLTPDLGYRE